MSKSYRIVFNTVDKRWEIHLVKTGLIKLLPRPIRLYHCGYYKIPEFKWWPDPFETPSTYLSKDAAELALLAAIWKCGFRNYTRRSQRHNPKCGFHNYTKRSQRHNPKYNTDSKLVPPFSAHTVVAVHKKLQYRKAQAYLGIIPLPKKRNKHD